VDLVDLGPFSSNDQKLKFNAKRKDSKCEDVVLEFWLPT